MALDINYGDFDTVCYSNQHNIIELIKHAVAIGIQINLNIADIGNINQELNKVKQDVEDSKTEGDQTAGDLNSLTLKVNEIERNLNDLRSDYNIFSYAVLQDLKSLSDRVAVLEGK